MIIWKKVEPSDRLGFWAAIAIHAASVETDNVKPGGIKSSINTINEDVWGGTTIDIGFLEDEPVAVVTYDCSMVTVHVLEWVRKHQLQRVALLYVMERQKAAGRKSIDIFCDNEELYNIALELGFKRPDDEDDFRDEILTYNVQEGVVSTSS